jgi:PPOX class probable F420-dependent enzyme
MLLEQMTHFDSLSGHRYATLTTFQKDGEPVSTVVSFALQGDRLYVMLPASGSEVQRIHANAQVEVAPCAADGTPLGASVEAMALVLADPQSARRALRRGLGFAARLRELALVLKREPVVYLEITPM